MPPEITEARSRKVLLLKLDDFVQLPSQIPPETNYFCLFLAMDSTGSSHKMLSTLARHLLDRGLAYVCCWGPGCERLHNIFDEERSPDETEETVVVTTWHDDEPIEEALWYFLYNANPTGIFEGKSDWIAVTSKSAPWQAEIGSHLRTLTAEAYGVTITMQG